MFMAHALMENRNGLLVDFLVCHGDGGAGCGPRALDEARERGIRRRTLRHEGLRGGCTWRQSGSSSAIGRTTRHRGCAQSALRKAVIEEIARVAMKTVGGFRNARGLDRTGLAVGTAYNLVRMARLMTAETPAPQAAQAA